MAHRRRDDHSVAFGEPLGIASLAPERRAALENEEERKLATALQGRGRALTQARHARRHDAPGRRRDPEVAHLEAVEPVARIPVPRRAGRLVPHEALPAEVALGEDRRGGELELVVGERLVVGRRPDLDHLEAGRALEHAVPDARRLEHAVALAQHERRALVLVDHPHPALRAVDHLEAHLVEVDVVGHGSAGVDTDLRRDEAAVLPARGEVSVAHPRAAFDPDAVARSRDRERRKERGQLQRRIGEDQLDARSVRRDDLPRAACERRRIDARESQPPRRAVRAAHEAEAHAVPAHHGDARVVRREDGVDTEAEPLGEERLRDVERLARKHDLGGAHVRGGTQARAGASCHERDK